LACFCRKRRFLGLVLIFHHVGLFCLLGIYSVYSSFHPGIRYIMDFKYYVSVTPYHVQMAKVLFPSLLLVSGMVWFAYKRSPAFEEFEELDWDYLLERDLRD